MEKQKNRNKDCIILLRTKSNKKYLKKYKRIFKKLNKTIFFNKKLN